MKSMESEGLETQIQAFLNSLKTQSSFSSNTQLAYQTDLIVFVEYLNNRLNRLPTLEDLTTERIVEFLAKEKAAGRQTSTLHRRLAAMKKFEAFLRQSEVLPTSQVRVDWASTSRDLAREFDFTAIHFLTAYQIQRLKDVLNESQKPLAIRDLAIFSLLLDTGITVSAVIAIDLPDLDLRGAKLHQVSWDERDIWIPVIASVEPIRSYLKEGRPELKPPPEEAALFISQVGTRMTRQNVWQLLSRLGKAAGLPFSLTPRTLRHTTTLRLFRSGTPLRKIQAILSHSNPLSTQALLRRLEKAEKLAETQIHSQET
jgi:integrase/recombinase XerD